MVSFNMFLIKIPIRSIHPLAAMTYDVPFLRHMTSNKTYSFCMFSKLVNLLPIDHVDRKIGTHIDWTYTMYLAILH